MSDQHLPESPLAKTYTNKRSLYTIPGHELSFIQIRSSVHLLTLKLTHLYYYQWGNLIQAFHHTLTVKKAFFFVLLSYRLRQLCPEIPPQGLKDPEMSSYIISHHTRPFNTITQILNICTYYFSNATLITSTST